MARYIRMLLVSFAFISLGTLGPVANAQSAQLQGRVLDPSGAGVPKALVRAVDQRIGTEARAETNDEGEYTVPALNPGLYKVFVQAPGFSTAASDAITVTASQNAVLNFALQVSANATQVVVTAEKREDRLQDVPVPVSVLDADDLASHSQVLLRDYYSDVPGLSVAPMINNTQVLSIRGISTGGFSNPTVGVLVDDVPFGPSTGDGDGNQVPDLDPGDLARVEVLRGPQGTLYGANSMGGLIKFVTKDPSTEGFSARIEAGTDSVHNGAEPGFNIRGSANIPLNQTLAVRLSGFKRQDPGYIDNPTLHLKGLNEAQAQGVRLSAMWRPNENFSAKVSALYQSIRANGLSEVVKQSGLGDLQQNYIAGVGPYYTAVQAYSANLNYKLGSADLTSITGFNALRSSVTFDFTPFFGSATQNGIAANGFSGFGVTGTPLLLQYQTPKFTQEVRLSTPRLKNFEWLMGGFYTHEHKRQFDYLSATDPTTGQVFGQTWYENPFSTFEEYAAYLDLTYHFTDRFDVQIGGRESHDTYSTAAYVETGPFNFFLVGSTASVVTTPAQSSGTNTFTYLLTPRFKVTSNLMVYARLASGFRPGGPNAYSATPGVPAHFSPDKTQNYEVGLKSDFLNHKISVDASLYYIDWKSIQVALALSNAIPYQANGSRAKSQGAEFSVETRPLSGLTIGGWVSYDDAVLTQAFPAASTAYGIAGDRLPFAPRVSGNVSMEKDFRLWKGATAFVGATAGYVGDRLGIFQPTSLRQDLPGYARADFDVGVRRDSWTARIYVTNVSDARGLLNGGIGYVARDAYVYIAPRTVGLSLAKIF